MSLSDLITTIQPGSKITIKGKPFTVKQHIVWMQHRAGYTYDKWVLVDAKDYDGYRFFIDSRENAVGFAEIFHHEFTEPMPMELIYNGRKYTQTCAEFCTAEKVEGDEVYKQGDGEIWWDYVSADDEKTGLSLGRSWETWEREDLATSTLNPKDIELLN